MVGDQESDWQRANDDIRKNVLSSNWASQKGT